MHQKGATKITSTEVVPEQSRSLATLVLAGVAIVASAVVVLFLVLPLVTLLFRASESLDSVSDRTRETLTEALKLTFFTTGISLVIILLLGSPLAYLLARYRFPGQRIVDALVDLPIVLPPAVAGIALLQVFGRRGVLGQHLYDAGITISFSTVAVILAQCFVSAPFFIRSAKTGFSAVYRDAEDAARIDGASRLRVLRDITLPLALPALIAGAVLAWTRAVGEFGATILFAGNLPGRTQTMPLAIYSRYEAGDLDTALVLSSVLMMISLLVLFALRLVLTPSEREVTG